MSQTILETRPTTDQGTRRPMLHAYCTVCLELRYPERVPSFCGQVFRSNDEMIFDHVDEAPAEDLCVVCLHVPPPCPGCGAGGV